MVIGNTTASISLACLISCQQNLLKIRHIKLVVNNILCACGFVERPKVQTHLPADLGWRHCHVDKHQYMLTSIDQTRVGHLISLTVQSECDCPVGWQLYGGKIINDTGLQIQAAGC